MKTTTDDPALRVHAPLIRYAGVDAHSGDETDTDSPRTQRTYNRTVPEWRSEGFTAFLWDIDAVQERQVEFTSGRPGRRAGNPPRHRTKNTEVAKVKPSKGLPINCDDAAWFSQRTSWEKEALNAQAAYDFKVRTSLSVRTSVPDMRPAVDSWRLKRLLQSLLTCLPYLNQ